MTKTVQKMTIGLCAVALSLTLGRMPSRAEQGAAEAFDTVGYTVHAIQPQNQLDDSGYFNLLMQPGQRQIVEVEVCNNLPAPLKLSIGIHGAYTNQNGLIAYAAGDNTGRTAAVPFETLASIREDRIEVGDGHNVLAVEDDIWTLAPHAVVRIPVEIVMPKEPPDGQLLGGIVLSRVKDAQQAQTASFAVRSVYSYVIAMQLQSDPSSDIAPVFSIVHVMPGRVAGWDTLAVSIWNEAPIVITGAQLRVRIYADGADAPLVDVTQERVSMAPSSILPYSVALPEGKLPLPGTYMAQAELTYGGHTVSMQMDFVLPDLRGESLE